MKRKPKNKILFIYNPNAGKKRSTLGAGNGVSIDDIKAMLKQYQIAVDYAPTKGPNHATLLAKEGSKAGYETVIVAGGDGTINETANGLVGSETALGIIPMGTFMNIAKMLSIPRGTGNLLAQNLGIPKTLEESIDIAFLGKEKKIDIGCANDIYFTIMAGIGFDADMMKNTDVKLKNKFGIFAYISSAYKSILKSSDKYELQIDDRKAQMIRAKGILVANLGKIQGGIDLVPKTSIDNGILRIGIIQAKNWYFWTSLLFHSLIGEIHKSQNFTLTHGKHIEIKVIGKKKQFECDGNVFPQIEKLIIDIYPKALTVLMPY